jgi:hypothetical protein
LICFFSVNSCGKDHKSSEAADPAGSSETDTKEIPGTQIPNRVEETGGEQKAKIQLSDEAIGIKTGAQIIAHLSLATGISSADLSDNEIRDLNSLKKSLPEKNSLDSFSAAHPPAALKVASLYCIKLVDLEQKIQDGQGGGRSAKLPAIDYGSQKPMSQEVARIFYSPLIALFGGQDTATLPNKAQIEPALDRLVERLKSIPKPANGNGLGVKSYVVGMCTAVATSFITLWI